MFSDEVKEIKLTTEEDFLNLLKCIKESTWGGHIEKYGSEPSSCYVYIMSLFNLCKMTFPFSVLWADSPDFVIKTEDSEYGLEQTNATKNLYKQAESIFQNYPDGSLMELPNLCSNEPSREIAKSALRMPGEPLQSSGWGDYGQEKLWIRCFYHSIVKKTERLNSQYITKCPNQELIILDDTPTVGPRLGYAIPELKKQYQCFAENEERENRGLFDKIHIISSSLFIYDLMGEELECDIKFD